MKIKVGALFKILQLANAENDANITESANPYRGNKGVKNYGQLLAARVTLSHILEECDVEIELSPNDDQVLMPFIQRLAMGG